MPKMSAMIVPQPGGKFRMEERDVPTPGRHEVRVRSMPAGSATAIRSPRKGACRDCSIHAFPAMRSLVSSMPLARTLEAELMGTRVGVGWFGGSCGFCGHCRRGDAFACETIQSITGVTRDGGYATCWR
jgi:alcohol dehydrogenase